MESFKEMFLQEREQESLILSSVESLEKEKLAKIDYLCGLTSYKIKLNQHDCLHNNNIPARNVTDDNGLRLFEKINSDGSVAVFDGTMECSYNTHDKNHVGSN
jgi:hypothetical protein